MKVKKIIKLVFAVVYVYLIVFLNSGIVTALSPEQKRLFQANIDYLDIGESCQIGSASGSSKEIYILGDSLMVGMKNTGGLENKLTQAGWEVKGIEATEGDTIAKAIPKANPGSTTGNIIIALGTNREGNLASQIDLLINKLRSSSSNAKIYWVNTYSKSSDYSDVNKTLLEKSTQDNYSIIDWYTEVSKNPSKYSFANDGIHHTSEGYNAKADFLVSQIGSALSVINSDTSETVSLNGEDNKQKAFNYFISKGLAPHQSAGIVGNLIAESGVNPKRVQSTSTPAGDKDMITVNNKTGYGIAQWTSAGRQQGLVDFANQRGMSIHGDLALQLDYLMHEFSTNYKEILNNIKQAPDLRTASSIFMTKFERPADQSQSAQDFRASLGETVLNRYGNGTSVSVTSSAECTSNSSNVITGFVGFPLSATKQRIQQLNGGQFDNSKKIMNEGGHPYAAHDVMADPDTPVVSIFDGVVKNIGEDKCPGRLISIYSETQNVTVSYLHLNMENNLVEEGDRVKAGQNIGFVGPPNAGCGSAHLHIDVSTGSRRPGCMRESCPATNQALFREGSNKINLPGSLYESLQRLP